MGVGNKGPRGPCPQLFCNTPFFALSQCIKYCKVHDFSREVILLIHSDAVSDDVHSKKQRIVPKSYIYVILL